MHIELFASSAKPLMHSWTKMPECSKESHGT